MYSEDDLVLISGLQHLLYCERQFSLIHVENVWAENRFTAEGKVLHERVDAEGHESRRLFRQEYGMAVRSLEHGIVGKCDLVELYLEPGGKVAEAIPVEFKRGRDKEEDWDRVQLYAEALCLSEMLGVPAVRGDFYYLGAHRRTHVEFTAVLRETTIKAIARARELMESGATPAAKYGKAKCERCSLLDLCMPGAVDQGGKRVSRYVRAQMNAAQREGPDA